MRLRVSGRSSDLSRIQIHSVADAFRTAIPDIEIIPHFRESLGDKMQHDPLWSMPEKGVFTEDFVEDLREGRTDLVVHSWKDLPTEPRQGTKVVATLPRADTRDVLLVRRDTWSEAKPGTTFSVLSSSPRRAHNLAPFLSWALPVRDLEIVFTPVRGNVPTRIRKLVQGDHHALVVAKAALDRLLGSTAHEFAEMRNEVRENLDRCLWMILPISENPTGAAQGALAMEIATRTNGNVARAADSLNHHTTFEDAVREREILSSYGGGCHQKIGVTVMTREYGRIVSLKGLTDAGEVLDRFDLEREHKTPKTTIDKIWPGDGDWMTREPLEVQQPSGGGRAAGPMSGPGPGPDHSDISEGVAGEPPATFGPAARPPEARPPGYWVARAVALPESWELDASRPVWTAGLKTWEKLSGRGIWVNGSAEGLGEDEDPRADIVAGESIRWIKLTHDRAEAEQGLERLATYRLVSSGEPPDLSGYTHFFWTSGSRFLEAVERQPELLERWHACGPGNTHKIIRGRLGSDDRLDVWLTREAWLKDVVQ